MLSTNSCETDSWGGGGDVDVTFDFFSGPDRDPDSGNFNGIFTARPTE